MRCSHCGYHSFDDLKTCKKCGGVQSLHPEALSPCPDEIENSTSDAQYSLPVFIPAPPLNRGGDGDGSQEAVARKPKPFPPFLLARDHDASVLEDEVLGLLPDGVINDGDNNVTLGASMDTEMGITVAGALIFRRMAATGIDFIILAAICWSFIAVGAWGLNQHQGALLDHLVTQIPLRIAYYLLAVVSMLSYFTLFHGAGGQTPGKMVFNLQVVTEEGQPPTIVDALLRSSAGLLSVLCVGWGYLRILIDPQRRGWNDRMAGTRVIAVVTEESYVDGDGLEV